MQEMEHKAVERGVSMEQLMEYAGGAAARFIQRKYELRGKRVAILCGKGNNGETGENAWYILARTPKYGRTLLVFSPDEKVLDGIKAGLPRQLRIDVFGRP